MGAANPAMAIVGQNTPQVTTRQAPGVPPVRQGLNMSMAPAEYAWQPSQADLGQRQVAQIGVDGFNVPVAQRGFPTGAIASRQDALAERKARLQADTQKMLAGTDVFGKISDPYHVYGAEWGKYIQQDYQRFLQDEADAMFGGDRAQAANYLYTDPEGRGKMMSWAKAHDAAAKQSAGIGKRALDILGDIEAGVIEASPEERNAIAAYLNARDVNGVPITSGNIHDMFNTNADAQTAISAVEYRRKYLKDIDQFAEQMVSAGQARKIPGTGKYLLPIETKTDLEAMVDGEVQTMLSMGMFGGDEKKARAFAEQNLRNKVEWDTKVIEPFESVWSKEAAKAKYGSDAANLPRNTGAWSRTTRNFIADERVPTAGDPSATYEFVSMPMDVGPNKNLIPSGPIRLHSPNRPQGELVVVTGFSKPAAGGDWLVLGEAVSTPDAGLYNEWRSRNGLREVSMEDIETDEVAGKDFAQWVSQYGGKKGKPYQESLSKNKSAIESKLGTSDPYKFSGVSSAIEAYNKANGTDYSDEDFGSWPREAQENLMKQYGR